MKKSDLLEQNSGYNPEKIEDHFERFSPDLNGRTIIAQDDESQVEVSLSRVFTGTELQYIKEYPNLFAYKHKKSFYVRD